MVDALKAASLSDEDEATLERRWQAYRETWPGWLDDVDQDGGHLL